MWLKQHVQARYVTKITGNEIVVDSRIIGLFYARSLEQNCYLLTEIWLTRGLNF